MPPDGREFAGGLSPLDPFWGDGSQSGPFQWQDFTTGAPDDELFESETWLFGAENSEICVELRRTSDYYDADCWPTLEISGQIGRPLKHVCDKS